MSSIRDRVVSNIAMNEGVDRTGAPALRRLGVDLLGWSWQRFLVVAGHVHGECPASSQPQAMHWHQFSCSERYSVIYQVCATDTDGPAPSLSRALSWSIAPTYLHPSRSVRFAGLVLARRYADFRSFSIMAIVLRCSATAKRSSESSFSSTSLAAFLGENQWRFLSFLSFQRRLRLSTTIG